MYTYIYRGHVYDLGLMIDEDFMGIPWRFDGDKSQRYHGEIYAPPPAWPLSREHHSLHHWIHPRIDHWRTVGKPIPG